MFAASLNRFVLVLVQDYGNDRPFLASEISKLKAFVLSINGLSGNRLPTGHGPVRNHVYANHCRDGGDA
jgi:hypothetical protein